MLESVLATFETEHEEGLVKAEPLRLKESSQSTVKHQPRCPSAVNQRGRGDGPRRGDRQSLLAKQLCNPDLAPARWELLESGGVSRT